MENKPKRRVLSWAELKLAVFFSVVIVLVTFSIFFSGLITSIFQEKIPLTITIEDVGGLRVGAPVWLQGVTVGTVNKIVFSSKSEIVSITIGKEFQPFLYRDASAQVKAVGLLGSKYVELIRGTSSTGSIKPGQTITGNLNDPLKSMDENLSVTIKGISSLVNNVNKSQGVAGAVIRDTTLSNDFKSTVSNLSIILDEIRKNPKKFFSVKVF